MVRAVFFCLIWPQLFTTATSLSWSERANIPVPGEGPPGYGRLRHVATDAVGNNSALVVWNGKPWGSTDAGVTWMEVTTLGNAQWYGITMSADGSKRAATVHAGNIWTSADSGATWTENTVSAGVTKEWRGIAMSADGTTRAAVVYDGHIWRSTDSGATWNNIAIAKGWGDIAMSSDGTKMVAAVHNGQLWRSVDSGQAWTEITGSPSLFWTAVAMSADGHELGAVAYNDKVYRSADSGSTWQQNNVIKGWYGYAMAADGASHIATVDIGKVFSAGAYPTSAPTAAPTAAPTVAPTAAPTAAPTVAPTATPTAAPTAAPTVAPTTTPTAAPTSYPTLMGYPEPPTINMTSLDPQIGAVDVDNAASIQISFTSDVLLVNGGTVSILTHHRNTTITVPDSQLRLLANKRVLVISLNRKQSTHGSYGGLSTYDAEHKVVVGVGAVKTCNIHRCSGFQGMPYPYVFSVIAKLYCTLALSGSVEQFGATTQATFIVKVAGLFNVDNAAVSVIGVTRGSILVTFSVAYGHHTNGTMAYHNHTFETMFPVNSTLFGNFTILARSSHHDLALLQPPVIPPPPPPSLVDAAAAAAVITAVVGTTVGTAVGGAVGGTVASTSSGTAAGGVGGSVTSGECHRTPSLFDAE